MNKLINYLEIMRVNQWHKNAFVLLGFFALGDYFNYDLLFRAIVMTVVFCFASSAVYIFNDYHDIEADRAHHVKKNRPLASGLIRLKTAFFLSTVLCVLSISISFYISIMAIVIISLYMLNNLAYSLYLKKYPIIDVFQIGLGFMLRIFAGTTGIGIYISKWMVVTGFMLSLLMGFSKRYIELSTSPASKKQREVLKSYSIETLGTFIIIMAVATIITYSLYTLSLWSVQLHGTTNLIYTVPLVIFGVSRFIYLVMRKKNGDDSLARILGDKQIVIGVIIWALIYSLMIS